MDKHESRPSPTIITQKENIVHLNNHSLNTGGASHFSLCYGEQLCALQVSMYLRLVNALLHWSTLIYRLLYCVQQLHYLESYSSHYVHWVDLCEL